MSVPDSRSVVLWSSLDPRVTPAPRVTLEPALTSVVDESGRELLGPGGCVGSVAIGAIATPAMRRMLEELRLLQHLPTVLWRRERRA